MSDLPYEWSTTDKSVLCMMILQTTMILSVAVVLCEFIAIHHDWLTDLYMLVVLWLLSKVMILVCMHTHAYIYMCLCVS